MDSLLDLIVVAPLLVYFLYFSFIGLRLKQAMQGQFEVRMKFSFFGYYSLLRNHRRAYLWYGLWTPLSLSVRGSSLPVFIATRAQGQPGEPIYVPISAGYSTWRTYKPTIEILLSDNRISVWTEKKIVQDWLRSGELNHALSQIFAIPASVLQHLQLITRDSVLSLRGLNPKAIVYPELLTSAFDALHAVADSSSAWQASQRQQGRMAN